jgi:hypothetical protein
MLEEKGVFNLHISALKKDQQKFLQYLQFSFNKVFIKIMKFSGRLSKKPNPKIV